MAIHIQLVLPVSQSILPLVGDYLPVHRSIHSFAMKCERVSELFFFFFKIILLLAKESYKNYLQYFLAQSQFEKTHNLTQATHKNINHFISFPNLMVLSI